MNQEENTFEQDDKHLGFLNLMVLALTIFVLGAIAVDTIFEIPNEVSTLLDYFDFAICIIFFIEFLYRFWRAENKWRFMRWGWIDLISSIPMVDWLRAGRVLRVIRIIRIIRAFRSINKLMHHLFKDRAQGTITSMSIFATMLLMVSSILILQVENAPNSNILSAEDALWWAYVTITTVGYGDLYPVTTEGRLISAVLMTGGVGLFGTFAAYVASWFMEKLK
jgi:voltage-gated potassium channel